MIGKYEMSEIIDKERSDLEKVITKNRLVKLEPVYVVAGRCAICDCNLIENYQGLCWDCKMEELSNCF